MTKKRNERNPNKGECGYIIQINESFDLAFDSRKRGTPKPKDSKRGWEGRNNRKKLSIQKRCSSKNVYLVYYGKRKREGMQEASKESRSGCQDHSCAGLVYGSNG